MMTATSAAQGLERALEKLSSEECVVTLAKVLDNILTETSYNKKTRKLKLSNQTFARRVARHEGGVEFLLACRFSQRGQLLELQRSKESKVWLWEARKALHDHASGLNYSVPPLPPRPKEKEEKVPVKRNVPTAPEAQSEDNSVYSGYSSALSIDDELELEIMKELGDDVLLPSSQPVATIEAIAKPVVRNATQESKSRPLVVAEEEEEEKKSESLVADEPLMKAIEMEISGISMASGLQTNHLGDAFSTGLEGFGPTTQGSSKPEPITVPHPEPADVEKSVPAKQAKRATQTVEKNEPTTALEKSPKETVKKPIIANNATAKEEDMKKSTKPAAQNEMAKNPQQMTADSNRTKDPGFTKQTEVQPKRTKKTVSVQQTTKPVESNQRVVRTTTTTPVKEEPIEFKSSICEGPTPRRTNTSLRLRTPERQISPPSKVTIPVVITPKKLDLEQVELISAKSPVVIRDVSPSREEQKELGRESHRMRSRDNSIQDFLNEALGLKPSSPSDEGFPLRKRISPRALADDLENEMASLLAQNAEIRALPEAPQLGNTLWQEPEKSAAPEKKLEAPTSSNDDELEEKTLVMSNDGSRADGVGGGDDSDNEGEDGDDVVSALSEGPSEIQRLETLPTDDINYTSIHAHSDWFRLHQLMVQHGLHKEYEVCLGSLCTLSVVTADFPPEDLGMNSNNKTKGRNKMKRSWLPLELVQGLWKLVLSEDQTLDEARINFVGTKLYDVLLDSEFLQVLERDDSSALPHTTWVRVRKEKMVLLGYGLKISIDLQAIWMRKLVNAISGDISFWYGRYALPTIASAGDESETVAKGLLKDMDFIQSRIDVIGVVSGTKRHMQDCREYVAQQREAFRRKNTQLGEVKVGLAEQIGYDVALNGCQQVATCLYRTGQLFAKTKASNVQKVELANALHHIGMAAGEWGDYDFESQLYQKVMKVLQEANESASECAGDTLVSIGRNHMSQGDLKAAMNCYEEAKEIYRSQLGPRDDKVAKVMHHIGVVLCERGEMDQAMTSFKTSLKIRQGNGMAKDYDESMADTLCWIGKVYCEQGLTMKARKYFDTAREVKEEFFGADSLEVAEVLHNIAVLHDEDEDYERSLKYYRKSLKIRRSALGDAHEDVSELITCIGNVYRSMGDDETAMKAFRKALELRSTVSKSIRLNREQTRAFIIAHEDVLDMLMANLKSGAPEIDREATKSEIASIILKMGHLHDTIENYEKSLKCFEKALKIRLNAGDNVKAAQALNVIGISLAKRRMFIDAMSNFQQALTLRKRFLGDTHIDVAETLHNMGNCSAKSNDWNEARTYYDESLRIKRKCLGDKSLSVAQTLHNIGNVLASQGNNEIAMEHYEEALTVRKALLGNDHVEVGYSLHCIAKIHRKKHHVEAARENLSHALRIKRAKLGSHHYSVAETLEQLGSLYLEIGEDEDALTHLQNALAIFKAKLGDSIKVAEVYEILAENLESKGQKDRTLALLCKALRVRSKVNGHDDGSVASLHYRIGRLQRDEGLDHDALASFQAATRIRKKAIGRDDLMISDILTDAGRLQLKLGQIDVADKCFTESMRVRQLILDGKHIKIGECYLLGGDVLLCRKEYVQAIDSFSEALSIFDLNEGPKSLLVADARERLGVAYKRSGELDKAQDNYEKCLMIRTSVLGDGTMEVAKLNQSLGAVHFEAGNYSKAEELLRESVEVMVKKLGEDHMDVADSVLLLGKTCTKLNSPDEALMYFEQARLTKQQHLGDSHLDVAAISSEIGRAHVAKKEYEESLECFQSYLRSRRAAVGDDEIVSDVLYEIGNAEYELKQYDNSLKSLASALALYRVLLGDEHLNVAKTLYSLGLVYESKRDYRESMKYHKEAFRLRRRLAGADDLSVASSLECISTLYMKQPNLEKALQSMKEVLRIRTHNLGKHHVDVASSLYGMGVIFAAKDEDDKAMECYSVSLDIRKEELGDASVEVAQTLHNMGTQFAKGHDYQSALDHWRRALVSYRESGHSDEDHLVAVTIGNINMAESFLDEQSSSQDQ